MKRWRRFRKTPSRRLRERNQICLIVTFHHLIERGGKLERAMLFLFNLRNGKGEKQGQGEFELRLDYILLE